MNNIIIDLLNTAVDNKQLIRMLAKLPNYLLVSIADELDPFSCLYFIVKSEYLDRENRQLTGYIENRKVFENSLYQQIDLSKEDLRSANIEIRKLKEPDFIKVTMDECKIASKHGWVKAVQAYRKRTDEPLQDSILAMNAAMEARGFEYLNGRKPPIKKGI